MVHSHYLVSLHWVLCSDNGSCLLNVCWVPKSCHKSKQSSFRAHSALSAINFSSPHRLTLANASIWILLWKCLYIFFKSWKKILSQELGREYYNFLIRSNLTTSVEISFTQVHQLASRREREREREESGPNALFLLEVNFHGPDVTGKSSTEIKYCCSSVCRLYSISLSDVVRNNKFSKQD